jgi:hypothetical protein
MKTAGCSSGGGRASRRGGADGAGADDFPGNDRRTCRAGAKADHQLLERLRVFQLHPTIDVRQNRGLHVLRLIREPFDKPTSDSKHRTVQPVAVAHRFQQFVRVAGNLNRLALFLGHANIIHRKSRVRNTFVCNTLYHFTPQSV